MFIFKIIWWLRVPINIRLATWAEMSLSEPGARARNMLWICLVCNILIWSKNTLCFPPECVQAGTFWSGGDSTVLMWESHVNTCVCAWNKRNQFILASQRSLMPLTRRCDNKYLLNEWLVCYFGSQGSSSHECPDSKTTLKSNNFPYLCSRDYWT